VNETSSPFESSCPPVFEYSFIAAVFERLIIQAFKELFNKDISTAAYYFLFLCIGVFGEIVLLLQGAYYEYFLRR
jgi:hypothetical protein